MKTEDLVIGKEYYFDCKKKDKRIYVGRKSGKIGFFFKPTTEIDYLKEPDGLVGFLSTEQNILVE